VSAHDPVLTALRAVLDRLPRAERRIAEHVLHHPGEAAQSTVAALSIAAGVSTASVLRLSQRLGSARFKDFQIRLAREQAQSGASEGRSDLGDDIVPGDSLAAVVEKVAYAEASSISDTEAALDLQSLQAAIDLVGQGRRIEIFGVGASAVVALDLQQKFIRIGLTALAWSDAHMAWTSGATLNAADVAIAISHSGQTMDPMQFLEVAKGQGASTIAITSNPSSASRYADVILTTVARETRYRAGALGSRIAQLMVADCLFVGVARQNRELALDLVERTQRVVSSRHRL